jgi:hypothetical protein
LRKPYDVDRVMVVLLVKLLAIYRIGYYIPRLAKHENIAQSSISGDIEELQPFVAITCSSISADSIFSSAHLLDGLPVVNLLSYILRDGQSRSYRAKYAP